MQSSASLSYPKVFACILLSQTDRLRMYGFPDAVVRIIHDTISQHWPRGIQQQGPFQGTWEWKLRGRPWQGQGDESVLAKRLIIQILQSLAANGWMFCSACDLTKQARDKDTLFFRMSPPVQRTFFCMCVNESDKIRLIDSTSDDVTAAFTAVVYSWPSGVQDSQQKFPGCLQMKLRGNPWHTIDSAQVVAARILALDMLSAMDYQGYDLVASIDMSIGTSEEYHEVDTWFFASQVEKAKA